MEGDTVRLSKWPYTRTYCFQDFGRYSQCTLSHNCTVYHPDVINGKQDPQRASVEILP